LTVAPKLAGTPNALWGEADDRTQPLVSLLCIPACDDAREAVLTWRGADELMQRTITTYYALLYGASLNLIAVASERPNEVEPIAVRRCEIESF